MIRRIALLGVGLIGGALALAVRQGGWRGTIVGYARRAETLAQAQALGVIDQAAPNVPAAVAGADLIVLAAPLGAYRALLTEIQPVLTQQQILTDVGSAKQCAYDDCTSVFGQVPPRFIAAHPLAGSEKSGVAAATADLFNQRPLILTPRPDTDPEALAEVAALWRLTGAVVSQLDAATHDYWLAGTSHLPHALAYTLVHTLHQADPGGEIFGYGAGALRDVTRIAASDPALWQEIFSHNQAALLRWCSAFSAQFGEFQQLLQAGDAARLQQFLAQAQAVKQRFGTESL